MEPRRFSRGKPVRGADIGDVRQPSMEPDGSVGEGTGPPHPHRSPGTFNGAPTVQSGEVPSGRSYEIIEGILQWSPDGSLGGSPVRQRVLVNMAFLQWSPDVHSGEGLVHVKISRFATLQWSRAVQSGGPHLLRL